jgi:copper chaperone
MSNVINLKVTGMSCNHCVMNATKALKNVSGVEDVEVTLEPGSAKISGNMTSDDLISAIIDAGYEAELVN